MKSVLNHVAILVESIESVLEKNQFAPNLLGEPVEFPSIGTREQYIGHDNQMGRLLLMQAIGDGPYKNALNKRGPGPHHIALDVLNVDEFVASLSGSGLLLHPISLDYYNSHKQVYLCRPGFPVLIEVQEREKLIDNEYFIKELEFPFVENRFLEALLCDRLKMGNKIKMDIEGYHLPINNLIL